MACAAIYTLRPRAFILNTSRPRPTWLRLRKPLGTWDGGREKAPAAMCRKVAVAKLTGNPEIEIWGDGEQTRSFCYIDDCVLGLHKLMRSDFHEPLNLGQDRMVTIDELADILSKAAGITVTKKHVPGPQGVRGRNS